MIKLVKIYDEYHLVDTDGKIRADKDLCLNYIAFPLARFKGLDYIHISLSKTQYLASDGKTNLFEGIDLAIGTTMKHDFEGLSALNREQIEKLLGKTDKALDYVNKYYGTEYTVDELNTEPVVEPIIAVYKAYQQALDDNSKNIFTLEDMETCFNASRERIEHPDWDMVYDDFQDFCEKTISKIDGQIMEWEVDVLINLVSPDPNSTTKFEPFTKADILRLTPIKH